jgi:hypothetical protein
MDESFTFETDKTAVYYENSNFTNMPLFAEQELYCFLPAQQSILAEEESRGYWMPDYTCSKTNMGVYPQFSGYYDQSMDNTIVPVQDCFSMGIQDGYIGAEEGAYSCQASPFLTPQYPRPLFANHTQSPITPLGSPMSADDNFYQNTAPSFLTSTIVGYENNQDRGCECNYQSPIPSVDFDAMALFPSSQTPSPVSDSSYLSSPELGSPGSDDDDDDEEYENDLSLLPQQGNKELRGMGLYDDVPDLLYTNCSTPSGCSPITPHSTLGKGLVLERSFGLPEEMMMKDESSGKIVKGKFDTEDEEEEPMLYDEEESLEWDRGYQVTYQPQYDGISFYDAQINRQW